MMWMAGLSGNFAADSKPSVSEAEQYHGTSKWRLRNAR